MFLHMKASFIFCDHIKFNSMAEEKGTDIFYLFSIFLESSAILLPKRKTSTKQYLTNLRSSMDGWSERRMLKNMRSLTVMAIPPSFSSNNFIQLSKGYVYFNTFDLTNYENLEPFRQTIRN